MDETRRLSGRRALVTGSATGIGRSTVLRLTAEGAALMRKLRPVLKAHESRMIAKVGEDGREALIALLHEIADGGPRKRN